MHMKRTNETPFFCCGQLPSEGHTEACRKQFIEDNQIITLDDMYGPDGDVPAPVEARVKRASRW